MTSAKEIGTDLLRRLLAGERAQVPFHLAMLLEKSSPLDSGVDNYRQILPPELADLRLPPETSREIVETLCTTISRNPDAALISVLSFSGEDLAIKTVANVLTHPPRPLTLDEIDIALSMVTKYLPYRLSEDSEFLPKEDLEQLARVVKALEAKREADVQGTSIKHFAPQLLVSLERLGIEGS